MSKWVMGMAAASLMAGPALAQDTSAHGLWRTPERGGLIEISSCDSGLCGKIVGGNPNAAPAERLDRNNKNLALRGRALIGLYVFRGMKRAGKTWEGAIYNPEDGGTYKASATLKSPSELSVRGCIVWPLCKTQTWTRMR